jgi:hypothetical protein
MSPVELGAPLPNASPQVRPVSQLLQVPNYSAKSQLVGSAPAWMLHAANQSVVRQPRHMQMPGGQAAHQISRLTIRGVGQVASRPSTTMGHAPLKIITPGAPKVGFVLGLVM